MKKTSEEYRHQLSDAVKQRYKERPELIERIRCAVQKPIHTPLGTFESCGAAAKALNFHTGTISDLLKSDLFPEWTVAQKEKTTREPVITKLPNGYELIDLRNLRTEKK